MAEFAIQITISELSFWVKGKTGLSLPYKLAGLGKLGFYKRLLGKFWVVLSPLLFVIMAFSFFHKFVSKMVDCPYCTGFHLAWIVNHFYLKMTLPQALLLAPLCLVFVAILDNIHSR